jgi:predicted alpha/beta hydrolase family esterase
LQLPRNRDGSLCNELKIKNTKGARVRIPVLFIQGGGEGAHSEDAPLAASLQKALGAEYDVRYPQMPGESNPDMPAWKAKIAKEFEALGGGVVLVGHSVGGAALLKYLSEENVEKPIAGLFLLAAPSRDEENWNFDDLRLPRDLAAKLSRIPQIFLYHNRDDEVVPFSHLALHAARLPRAFEREGDKGGHQFGNDLANVASDIRTLVQVNADKTF